MHNFLSSGHVTCDKDVPSPSTALAHLRSSAALLHSPANVRGVPVVRRASVELQCSPGWVWSPSLQADSQKARETVVGWERGFTTLLCVVHWGCCMVLGNRRNIWHCTRFTRILSIQAILTARITFPPRSASVPGESDFSDRMIMFTVTLWADPGCSHQLEHRSCTCSCDVHGQTSRVSLCFWSWAIKHLLSTGKQSFFL